MQIKIRRASVAMVLSLSVVGCDGVRTSPQVIDADGQIYIACSGLVWAKDTSSFFSGSPVFKVSFTDTGNKSHTIWGVKTLKISEPPDEEIAPFPSNLPDPKLALDIDGKGYTNGSVYTWSDGSKAEFVGGKWKPVRIATACK